MRPAKGGKRGKYSPTDPFYWRWLEFGARGKPGVQMLQRAVARNAPEVVVSSARRWDRRSSASTARMPAMSAERTARRAHRYHAPLIAQVPPRISIDAVLPTVARPFVAFSKQQRSDELGLDGGLLAVQSTIDIQCVGSSRSNAIVVADLVRDALRAAGMPSDRGSAGYDAENDLEVEIVTVDWFDV